MNVLEDEYHFVLVCPAYRSFRSLYLTRYYCTWPNRQKRYNLLKACDKNLTITFCRYLNSAWKLRLDFFFSYIRINSHAAVVKLHSKQKGVFDLSGKCS